MPRYFEAPAQNYRNVDEFKESAIKTINNLWGHKRKYDIFDFAEREHEEHKIMFYTCTAYYKNEKMPPEAKAGEALTPEQVAANEAARLDAEKRAAAGEGLFNATDSAVKLAAENKVDLKLVTGSGANGRIGQPDVAKYIKERAVAGS